MQIYKLPRSLMAQDGKGILRSLQNENMPYADIVIREALQNSLDATNKDEDETVVEIQTNKFNSTAVAYHFEEIESELVNRFPGEQLALVLKDKNTSGLSGSIDTRTDNDTELKESKFYKLVYGLSMNQDEQGAGGSWGLGKTSYFRVGAGIVIYYTRVKLADGTYQERLAGSLIENPDGDNPLLDSKMGLAWWGENNVAESGTHPIVDSAQIRKIISDFGVDPYVDNETGTTIIIPYIDRDKLTNDRSVDDEKIPWFAAELNTSLKLAVQRWYGPRILNSKYHQEIGNSELIVSVNGDYAQPAEFEQTFRIFRRLYDSALTGKAVKSDIEVKEISGLRKALTSTSEVLGRVAFTQVSFEELHLVGGDQDLTPSRYVGVENDDDGQQGQGIIAYSRKPGMVVEYVNDASPWMQKVNIPDNTYLLAFFVPISSAKLHSDYNKNGYDILEDYLRDTESADHAEWKDKTNITLIKRIRDRISRSLREVVNQTEQNAISSRTSNLSRQVGQSILPPSGWGKAGSPSDNGNDEKTVNPSVSHMSQQSDIKIENVMRLSDEQLRVEYEAFLTKNSNDIIAIEVLTNDGLMNEEKWNSQLEGVVSFPFEFKGSIISKSDNSAVEIANMVTIKDVSGSLNSELEVTNNLDDDVTINGALVIKVRDFSMQPSIHIRNKVAKGGNNK
ncbi:hypothetical protein [Latilactobacillus sakei]|uniref:hypothetical protein n=1 Tax=Latilactobacillus sakei TaxID=1599 RepID=UPI002072C328|nr:hypothetical protein [Latilactobacillus sakei]USF95451.1 hypothetical protein A4W82_00670 [Latilactobacillus sakei]